MRLPRFRVRAILVVVGLVALYLGSWRWVFDHYVLLGYYGMALVLPLLCFIFPVVLISMVIVEFIRMRQPAGSQGTAGVTSPARPEVREMGREASGDRDGGIRP